MNFSVEETPDSNVCIPMPVAGTFETCRRTRSMSVFIGGHRKSSAHAQNDAIDPGCVKSPSFNLRVEHLSQFHRYGNQLALATSVGRRQLRKQFRASLAQATFHTAW